MRTNLVLMLAMVALQGCALYDPRLGLEPAAPVLTAPPPVTTQVTGSIYQASSYRPLFEDHRARLPGDTLLINIVEKVSATQKSTSSIDKQGGLTAGIKSVPLLPTSSLARLQADVKTNNNFAGKGSTESTNEFSGVITVVVSGVLPNGHLLISGEKQIGVNQNVDVLRFSGQVDPRSIQPGNSIQSAQVANVRLEQRGRGQAAEAQAMGWLSRFFLNVMPL
jgi:flagellar L-ring protein FlgH